MDASPEILITSIFSNVLVAKKNNKKLFQSLKIAQKRNLSLHVSNVIC